MNRDRSRSQGFTLIEIMMVVAILGIVLSIAIPSINHLMHKEALSGGVSDVVKICSTARAQAILRGVEMRLVIHPRDGRFELRAMGAAPKENRSADLEFEAPPPPKPLGEGQATFAQLSDQVSIQMLDINFAEYKDVEETYVRFFPNGTSDECTLVLQSDRNEYRKISLEVVTALADVEQLR